MAQGKHMVSIQQLLVSDPFQKKNFILHISHWIEGQFSNQDALSFPFKFTCSQ